MQLLVDSFEPQIFCLQETNFKHQNTRQIKSYKTFNKNRNSRHTSGGVVTLIRSTIHSEEITISSNYEVIFTKIKINLYICNLYVSNSQQLNESELTQLTNQLPKPFIILGNLNSHNTFWELQNR